MAARARLITHRAIHTTPCSDCLGTVTYPCIPLMVLATLHFNNGYTDCKDSFVASHFLACYCSRTKAGSERRRGSERTE